jgi:transketolase
MRKGGIPTKANPEHVDELARHLRRQVLRTIAGSASGHPGGSLSATEILISLYFRVMAHDPDNPKWEDRDRFVLSKGHCTPILYSVLAECGYFPNDELSTFRRIDSRLQGHAHTMVPGVDASTGSLGQGLSMGLGMALAGRLDKKEYMTYVLIGDGECDEGQIWEAAMAASHYKAGNLVAIIDRNRIQNDRFTSEAMEIEPLADKWLAFGWKVVQADGHNVTDLCSALDSVTPKRDAPLVVIANTTKGKGVSFMENNPGFHGRAPNQQELADALSELAG